jgi:hypothetical protein
MSIRINPLSPAAAEIFGLDCSGPLRTGRSKSWSPRSSTTPS